MPYFFFHILQNRVLFVRSTQYFLAKGKRSSSLIFFLFFMTSYATMMIPLQAKTFPITNLYMNFVYLCISSWLIVILGNILNLCVVKI